MTEPLVSVLLPVYNAAPYLGIALDSLLSLDYRHMEIVAIDDGSTDGSLAILERYRRADGRIAIVSRENRGLIATLNEGLQLCSGAFVARMDADDIAYPQRLSRQMAAFADDPALAICGAGGDSLVGRRLQRHRHDPIFQTGSLAVLSQFFTLFPHSCVIYNRRIVPDSMLVYDPSYPHAEDFELFRRIALVFPARRLDESLIAIRYHPTSVTGRQIKRMRQTHLKIVTENLAREGVIDEQRVLRGIGDAVTNETIRGAADFYLELEAWIADRPADLRASYEVGAKSVFYFLYRLIWDEQRPEFTHAFLSRTGKWSALRRRERYGLFAGSRAPWLAQASLGVAELADMVAGHMKSVSVRAVLPEQHAR